MEETEPSSGYMNDLVEESEDDEFKRGSIFSKQRINVPCGCNDKNYCGKKCECFAIKEDLRTLFSLGELIDKLIAGQKKALQAPLEHAKLYNMLNMVFDMNLKFDYCKCEEDESLSSDDGLSIKKDIPRICDCPDLPRKRCVLRIVRNDIYERMKLAKRYDFLLKEKNKKIKEMIRKRERSDPCSPYVTKSVSFDENLHRLLERTELLKEMKEEDLPKECLFDKKELLEHIGQHRILTKPLRHIYLVEELANKVRKRTQKKSDSDKCDELVQSEEQDKCICPETDKKIEFIKNFKCLIARLNPILNREEEMLEFSQSERRTFKQLIEDKKKQERQKLINFIQNRKESLHCLMEPHLQLEEDRMLTEIIQLLTEHVKQLEDILKSCEQSEPSKGVAELKESDPKPNEMVVKLTNEKKELEELTDLLDKYKKRNKDLPDDGQTLLEEINEKLEDYLEKQKQFLEKMEKLTPGFKISIFDEELKKDKIVAEICRDDDKKGSELERPGIYESSGRERLMNLIKRFTKPHLNVVGSPLKRNKMNRPPVGKKKETSQKYVENSQTKKSLVNELGKFKNTINEKLNGEINECQYEIIEKELVKELSRFEPPPLPKDEQDNNNNLPILSHGEMAKMKLRDMAFEEGRKIVSQPDLIMQRLEKHICRKRLVRELGLKCNKGGACCSKNGGPSKMMLKVAYETGPKKDCRCKNRLKELSRLENDFEDIILQPEKHHIDFVDGPLQFINTDAIKKMRAFIHKHAKKKSVRKETDFDFDLSKRKLVTEYNESRFYVVWKDFERQGLFSINLEAQTMTNERIIIRPQYKKRVKVLSGGRIGLDPLYAEYVCTGMLDGVVLGDESNAPIPRTILQAIKELDSGDGVVIIILNDFQERLNFLFAIERAKKLGIDAELVLARDDISEDQPDKWRYGSRGHAGIILQYKVAAGMAAMGYNLAAIARVTQGMQIATLDCYLTKFGPFVGAGIRNGRGYYVPGLQAEEILSEILRQLIDPVGHHAIVPEPGTKMIILINKFKLSHDDVYSVVSIVGKKILETGGKVGRVYHGNFSAFTRSAFSITLAKDWNDELIKFLDYPTTCVHWPPHLSGSRNFVMTRTRFHRKQIVGALVSPEYVNIVFEILDRTLRDLAFCFDRLFEECVPLGVSLLNVVWTLKPNLKRLSLNRPYLLLTYIGKVLNVNIPIFGKHFQLLLVVAAQEFIKDPDFIVNWRNWCQALLKGTQSFAAYTKFRIGEGTILDYLKPFTEAIKSIKKGWSPLPFLYEALEKVNCLVEKRKNDVGTLILGHLFRNVYLCLNEFLGHEPADFWWKVRPSPQIVLINKSCKDNVCHDEIPEDIKEKIRQKEKQWVEYSSPAPSVYSVNANRDSEPSIERRPLEDEEGDAESIRSAVGLLYEPIKSKKEIVEDILEKLSSLYDESDPWVGFW